MRIPPYFRSPASWATRGGEKTSETSAFFSMNIFFALFSVSSTLMGVATASFRLTSASGVSSGLH